jgi:hypothetical protein
LRGRAPKAGVFYFALVFAAGWLLGPVRQRLVVPRFGETAAVALEAPFMILAMCLAARWTVRRLAVASAARTRAAVGLIALALLLIAELAGARWLRRMSMSDYLTGFASTPGAISLLLFLLYAVMPMLVECRRRPPGCVARSSAPRRSE